MSDEPLKDFEESFKAFTAHLEAKSLAIQSKVREANAVLDSVSGEEAKHAAQVAFASAIAAAMKGEALVSAATPSTIRKYVIGGGVAVGVGALGVAAKVFGLI